MYKSILTWYIKSGAAHIFELFFWCLSWTLKYKLVIKEQSAHMNVIVANSWDKQVTISKSNGKEWFYFYLDWLISSESLSSLPLATFLFITQKSSPPPALKNCLLSVCNHLSKAEKKGWYELKQRRCLARQHSEPEL